MKDQKDTTEASKDNGNGDLADVVGSKPTGLIGKTVKYLLYDGSEREGFVLDKVMVSRKGIHTTGMFHFQKHDPYSILEEMYLVQYKEQFGSRVGGQYEDGKYWGWAAYRDRTEKIEPTKILSIVGEGNLLKEPEIRIEPNY